MIGMMSGTGERWNVKPRSGGGLQEEEEGHAFPWRPAGRGKNVDPFFRATLWSMVKIQWADQVTDNQRDVWGGSGGQVWGACWWGGGILALWWSFGNYAWGFTNCPLVCVCLGKVGWCLCVLVCLCESYKWQEWHFTVWGRLRVDKTPGHYCFPVYLWQFKSGTVPRGNISVRSINGLL